ncbi:SemiSWEET family sugar transporter [Prochlorococcus marinus]|uniref:SemiSWEET family sugar transporter n=1 Tax=Prochlorococcus marinus TaxID=1219 RepID=UPI0022B442CE|nr:SemiSWEET transporter [Prochlorococcus marinus]
MNDLFPDIFGFLAALLTSIAFLPQVIKIWKTKNAEDISITMLVIFISGLLFWIIYAIKKNDLPVLLANLTTLVLNSIILGLKLVYKVKSKI